MDDERVEVVVLLVQADGWLYHYLRHDLAVPLRGHAVLEALDADDEVVGELREEVPLDGLG